jgi:hypothetical protein
MQRKKSPLFRRTSGEIQATLDQIATENDLGNLKSIVDSATTPDIKKAAQARFNEVLVLQDLADGINGHYADAVLSIIATGQALITAKKRLPHGHWGRLFAGHPDAIKNTLCFTVSTAQRLMKIARHPVISNGAHAQHLPNSWATLHQLTKVEPELLENAIADGRIHPAMQRKDVARLAAPRHVNSGGDDDQVEALNRQVETAADPVSMDYAPDPCDRMIAQIKAVVQRELKQAGKPVKNVKVMVFKPSPNAWLYGFRFGNRFHDTVRGVPGNPSGGMLVIWRSDDSDKPPF